MGKNRVIKSLGRCIGNVALHKILVERTNKPESKNYLESEVLEYGSDAFEKAQVFNWSEDDRARVREVAVRRIQNLIKNYPDVSFDDEAIERMIEETVADLML